MTVVLVSNELIAQWFNLQFLSDNPIKLTKKKLPIQTTHSSLDSLLIERDYSSKLFYLLLFRKPKCKYPSGIFAADLICFHSDRQVKGL